MSSSATIKCFTLNLDKAYKGNPKTVTISCVYSYNGKAANPMGIGYVLAIGDTITEIRCFNEGLKDMQAFMNTDKIDLIVNGETLESFRLEFSDRGGQLKGFMMQGPDGDDIAATENFGDDELQKFKLA